MTAKVMFGAIGGIILIVGLFAFETIRTGSPAEVMFADQLITGAQVAAGVVVGIVGVNMAQKSVGWHHVVYETRRRRTDRVRPDQRQRHGGRHRGQRRCLGVRPDARTRPVPPDEARRRGRDPRRHPPRAGQADQTPDPQHAIAIGENEWITRTAKQTPTQSPDVEADYVYSSPIELSYDKFVGMKESNRRKDIRLTSLESTVAVLEKNLRNWSAASRAGSTKRNSRSSRRSNRSATLSVRRRRNPTGSRIRVIRTSTLATPNRTAAGRRPPMEAPNEHRAILAALLVITAALPARAAAAAAPTQTHRHRRSSSKRTTARTRRTRTTRRPVAVRIPTSRMTNRLSTPTTARPARPPACASRRSTSAKSGWEPRRPTATPSTQPPVRSHSSRCRRRRRTHESRSRPRAPNSLKANKRSASITTTTPRPPTAGYYEVELFFEDGSTKTIGLTASGDGRERRRVGLRRVSGAHRGNGRARD